VTEEIIQSLCDVLKELLRSSEVRYQSQYLIIHKSRSTPVLDKIQRMQSKETQADPAVIPKPIVLPVSEYPKYAASSVAIAIQPSASAPARMP